jgi:hypothetical protein
MRRVYSPTVCVSRAGTMVGEYTHPTRDRGVTHARLLSFVICLDLRRVRATPRARTPDARGRIRREPMWLHPARGGLSRYLIREEKPFRRVSHSEHSEKNLERGLSFPHAPWRLARP